MTRRIVIAIVLVSALVVARIATKSSHSVRDVGAQSSLGVSKVYLAQSTRAELYLTLSQVGPQLKGRLSVAYLAGRGGEPVRSVPARARAHYSLRVLQPVFITGSIMGQMVKFEPVNLLGSEVSLVAPSGLGILKMNIGLQRFDLGRLTLMPVTSLSFPQSLRGLERIAADLNSPNYPAFS
ncbi:MAG: hypothetical protein ACP5O0_09910 [Acidimicrobiales bacterium]